VEVAVSLTLSAYMLDRFSIKSEMASLLLRATISLPNTRKYRISVPFKGRRQHLHEAKQVQSLPWRLANDVRVSQIGTFMGRSRTFPKIG
jgi:hypothetical protein